DQAGIGDPLLAQQQPTHPVLAVQVQHAGQAGGIPAPMPGVPGVPHPAEHEPAEREQVQPERLGSQHAAYGHDIRDQALPNLPKPTRSTASARASMINAGTSHPNPCDEKGNALSQAVSLAMNPAVFRPSMIPKASATSMTGRMIFSGRARLRENRPRHTRTRASG